MPGIFLRQSESDEGTTIWTMAFFGTLCDAMRHSPTLALLFASLCACSSPPEYPIPRADPPGIAPPSTPTPALACAGEGEVITAPSTCCEGLTRVDFYKGSMIRLDACELEGKGRATCVRCGNGRCGTGENACNCPADCPF
jgi:hypothetical protein